MTNNDKELHEELQRDYALLAADLAEVREELFMLRRKYNKVKKYEQIIESLRRQVVNKQRGILMRDKKIKELINA